MNPTAAAEQSATTITPLMLAFTPDWSIQRPSADPRVVPPIIRSSAGIGPTCCTLSRSDDAVASGSGSCDSSWRRLSSFRCASMPGTLEPPK